MFYRIDSPGAVLIVYEKWSEIAEMVTAASWSSDGEGPRLYLLHAESPEGREIFRLRKALTEEREHVAAIAREELAECAGVEGSGLEFLLERLEKEAHDRKAGGS